MVSCGDNNSSSSNDYSEKEATEVIAYTNDIVGYLNKFHSAVDKYATSHYRKMSDYGMNKGGGMLIPFAFNNNIANIDYNRIKEVPASISEDKEFFVSTIEDARKLSENLETSTKKLVAHIKAEDYKEDDFKSYQAQLVHINGLLNSVSTVTEPLYAKIDVVGNDAETVLLKNHPYGNHIMASKACLNRTMLISQSLSKITPDGDVFEIEKLYADLETDVAKARGLDTEVLKENFKETGYNNFLDRVENSYMSNLKKYLRDFKAGTIKEQYFERETNKVINNYDGVVSSYNSFAS